MHDGAIGEAICGQVYYHTGVIPYKVKPDPANPEARMRNWVADKALSGDIIVEQNIHATDVADWFLGGHPLQAYGTGGTKGRQWGDLLEPLRGHLLVSPRCDRQLLLPPDRPAQLPGHLHPDLRPGGHGRFALTPAWSRSPARTPSPAEKRPTSSAKGPSLISRCSKRASGPASGSITPTTGAQSTLTAVLGRTAAYQNRGRDLGRADPGQREARSRTSNSRS